MGANKPLVTFKGVVKEKVDRIANGPRDNHSAPLEKSLPGHFICICFLKIRPARPASHVRVDIINHHKRRRYEGFLDKSFD